MIKKAIYLSSFLLLLSCMNTPKNQTEEKIVEEKIADTIKVTDSKKVDKTLSYSIRVENIDSITFFKAKELAPPNKKKPEKITDFKTVKKLLSGIVEFDDSERYGSAPAVRKINFKNGTTFSNDDDFHEGYFLAYFPSEDILLCEGGHSTDVSFNLKNGKFTEETGNPNEISASPNNKFRLNSHYGGQECSSYFIQKNYNGNFEKIVQLDEEFEKITKHWLCTIGENFWANDQNLFLTETNFADGNGKLKVKYFKITLKQ